MHSTSKQEAAEMERPAEPSRPDGARRVARSRRSGASAAAAVLAVALGALLVVPLAAQQVPPVVDATTQPQPSQKPQNPPPQSPQQPPAEPAPAPATGPAPERAQSSFAGDVIESVEWQGLRTLSEETVAYYLGLQQGQRFDPEKLNENIHQLWDRGLIDDISVEAAPGAQGVRLTVSISERPVLRSVEYKGLKKIGRTDINERIDKEHIRVREGLPVARGELERLAGVLEDMYREKGYRFAQVDYDLQEVNPGDVRAVFTVDEGDKVKIQKINFTGNQVFSDWRLRQAMRKTRQSGPISRIMKRDIYNPANFQEDLDKVRDLYKRKGYKNVTLGEPDIAVKAMHPKAAPKKQKRRLFITIPIDEGKRFKFGEISIEGNKVYSDEMLLKAFQKPRGHSPWLRSTAVDKGVEAVSDLYRNTGYIYAHVEVELKERDDNVADVVVHVHEGDQYHVGRLEFKGNDRTKDKVLRREFRVQEGRVLNMGALKNSLYKLNQLNYFKIDENNPIEFQNFDSDKKTVDLVVKGTEADRTELLFGGGWSELDGFFGQFSIKTQNFMGRGETLQVAIQSGKVTDRYEFSYFVPWLFDRPQSAGFQLFSDQIDYVLYGSQRQLRTQTGGALTYGRNIGLFQSLRFTYGYTDLDDVIEVTDPTTGNVARQESKYKKSSIRPSWLYDSEDNRLEPTRGLRSTVSLEYAGGPIGGDISLIRPEGALTYFHPLSRQPLQTVFGFNLEGGLVQALEGQTLPVLERYYLGGPRSIRGFASRSIFLRDAAGTPVTDSFGNVLGGTSYLTAGLEYHLLLGGPFRLVFFTDAGNVFGSEGQHFGIDALRYTAGVELRLFVPVFGLPLRFIYSKNLRPLPGDRFETFQFDVGSSF